jgi:hypothetical protein
MSIFGYHRATPPQKGDRTSPPDKHCSKNCNLYEDYDCYVQELPTPSRRPECDEGTWESDAVQKLREAMAQDSDHLDRLRRSMDDGGLKIGYTNMSLKEVWLSPNFNEMIRKLAIQKSLQQALD